MRKTIYTHREEVLKAAEFINENRTTAYLWSNGSSNFYDVNGVIWEYWQEGLGNYPTTDGDLVVAGEPKKSISFYAIAGMGVNENTWYYWNGYEFIADIKVKFPTESIPAQLERAKEVLNNNHGLVAMYPNEYQFGVK